MLTPTDLADRWKKPARTLGQWRYEGRGPAYVKIGGAVRYRLADVEAYETEHLMGAR
ncbi:helix-turn-helix domain-containing protein [Arthrobacter sp. PL16]|uniref:helix-turn-helix domain-containing protein n=1 Tax=Arthrobacter sp. PL16 TaxID=3071720 RepID=UPI002E0D822C